MLEMNLIEEIKSKLDIVELANNAGAKVLRSGKCKHNPLREEKTCSLQIYKDTQTFHDFGSSETGDVIKFYGLLNGMDNSTTIKHLKEQFNIENDKAPAPLPDVDYMQSNIVRKIFNQQIELNFKEHKKFLEEMLPYWIYKEAKDEDVEYFQNIEKN